MVSTLYFYPTIACSAMLSKTTRAIISKRARCVLRVSIKRDQVKVRYLESLRGPDSRRKADLEVREMRSLSAGGRKQGSIHRGVRGLT